MSLESILHEAAQQAGLQEKKIQDLENQTSYLLNENLKMQNFIQGLRDLIENYDQRG